MKKLPLPNQFAGLLLAILPVCVVHAAAAEATAMNAPEERTFLRAQPTNDSPAERAEILGLYKNLRVADVVDGLDAIGLQDIGNMDPQIRSLWRDAAKFSHHIIGFAVTLRYVPTNVRTGQGSFKTLEEYNKFKDEQYAQSAPTLWRDLGKAGNSVLVIDAAEVGDVGFIGSNNSLGYASNGYVGVVTNGNARDTDEIIKAGKIPVYTKSIGRGIRPGRILLESANHPVSCGGVLVFPGDLIMADGDGVVVVPRARVREVARIATEINQHDQQGRADLFNKLNMAPDETVKKFTPKR